jgi:hypothetical protein
VVNSGGTLIATLRGSFVSRARYIAHPRHRPALDLVLAEAIPLLRWTARHTVDGGPLGKAPALRARQQRLDLGAQESIGAARVSQKRRPRGRAPFERALKQRLHTIPAARVVRHASCLVGPAVIRR